MAIPRLILNFCRIASDLSNTGVLYYHGQATIYGLPKGSKKSLDSHIRNEFVKTVFTNNTIVHKDLISQIGIQLDNASDPLNRFVYLELGNNMTSSFVVQIEGINRFYVFPSDMVCKKMINFLKKESANKSFLFKDNAISEQSFVKDVLEHRVVNVLKANNMDKSVKSKTKNSLGLIYLIQPREFLGTSIYKIGKTRDELNKRLGNYGKGGNVICVLPFDNEKLDQIEKDIITKFNIVFINNPDIGTEYFTGDYKEMISIIYDLHRNH